MNLAIEGTPFDAVVIYEEVEAKIMKSKTLSLPFVVQYSDTNPPIGCFHTRGQPNRIE
jgi:hypothetical protein